MPITLLCPRLSCRAILRVPDNVRGERVRCGECGTAFIVPLKGEKTSTASQSNVTSIPADKKPK